MILGVGIDICDVKRVSKTLEKFNNRFITRCFTSLEIKKCKNTFNKAGCFAKRFAAKEATSKALGTGINKGVYWKQIEVENLKSGKPTINLYGSYGTDLYLNQAHNSIAQTYTLTQTCATIGGCSISVTQD